LKGSLAVGQAGIKTQVAQVVGQRCLRMGFPVIPDA
jgi:hypothetical protein